ncbi:MAG: 30S ribosomal protein S16 [Candidatus Omnitrophota bacterium]
MAVRIRLSRPGKGIKKRYFFRISVMDSRQARDSRAIEQVGYYNPEKSPAEVVFKKARMRYWLSQGAGLSPTVKSLWRKAVANKAQ